MKKIKVENKKQKLIYNNILNSIRKESEDSNDDIINLKMRKIDHSIQNNSDKRRIELKKLLGDLNNSKFSKEKSKVKINRLKLTPFQKLLNNNAKAKKALLIKKNLILNPQNLEYIIKFNNIKNKNYKNAKMKNIHIFKNGIKAERSFHSYNKLVFELSKIQNKNNPEYYNNFCVKNIKLPSSRKTNSYKEVKNNNLNIVSKRPITFIKNKNTYKNVESFNSNQLIINNNEKNRRANSEVNNNYSIDNYSKTFSKINSKMPIIKKRENINELNKYIRTNYNERNKEKLKLINFVTEPKIYSYLGKKEKSKKLVINKENINKEYYSLLLNKTKYKKDYSKKYYN